ncbi:hypothetical protein JCM10450v2_001960 [Rhodotorula kratochvilovae]
MSAGHIVVLGAGVVGLSTAIRLLEAGYTVDVVARDLPGDDKTIAFTSPWAGAHHVSVATSADMRLHEFDARTFRVMSSMIEQGHESLFFCTQKEYRELPRPTGDADRFRWLDSHELPEGIQHGAAFTAILIDTPTYLPSLVTRLTQLGGRLHRIPSLSSLSSALSAHPSLWRVDLLVNCTGLGARTLVPDEKVFPTRGQLVIVRAPWITEGVTRLGPDSVYDYLIPRPKSGHVVLGGCAEKNNWDPRPRADMARRIKERCLVLCPELLPPEKRGGTIDDLDVVEDAVGLRPTREGGIRLEIESLNGGYGYQSSWGSAEAAVELVKEALSTGKSKL